MAGDDSDAETTEVRNWHELWGIKVGVQAVGSFFGESAVIDNDPRRNRTVVATRPSDLAYITHSSITALQVRIS